MPRAGATGAAGLDLDYFALMRRATATADAWRRGVCACARRLLTHNFRFNTPRGRAMLRVSALVLAAVAVAADFRVKFEVEVPSGAKEFTVLVHEDWAPIGAALCGM